jgi:hypothetical protein
MTRGGHPRIATSLTEKTKPHGGTVLSETTCHCALGCNTDRVGYPISSGTGEVVDEIIQLLQSPAWWFSNVGVPLILTGLTAALYRLLPALHRMAWADVVVAVHCVAALGLAFYIAGWTPMLRADLTGWDYWTADMEWY